MFLPPVPSFALKFVLGEMADVVLKGSRVSSKKLVDSGFNFEYNDLEMALQSLIKIDQKM
jgi:NAD dependent epimerase/dehydratase family enzyme